MPKKRDVIAGTLIAIAMMLAATACAGGVRVGDLQTKSQTVELGDADSVDVEIQMGAGELDVSGGASELLDASFSFNVAELDPEATYTNGTLVVSDKDVREGIRSLFDLDEYRNEWGLKLNEDVPMDMTIGLGAGRSNLALGTLALTSLNIEGGAGEVDLDLSNSESLSRLDFDMGAGEVTIDLSGDWNNDLDARLTGGLGEVTLRLPSDVGVRVNVETGIGGVDASGLTKDGNIYTNDAYGVSDVTLLIDLEAGVGQIHLDVE